MNQILKQITSKTKEDLQGKKRVLAFDELKKQVKRTNKNNLFYNSIIKSVNDPAVIAEVKLKAPSTGKLGSPVDLIKKVIQYREAGADAISIITEPHFFGGNSDFIGKAKESVDLPVLQKDFVIDEYQIYEAGKIGSDALLLIARLTDSETLSHFVKVVKNLGIEPVVEIYSGEDLEKAVKTETKFIAVNARDLDTFEINVNKACGLLKKIPPGFIKLGFSGVKSSAEVNLYRNAGARGILIGTALMKANNIKEISKISHNLGGD